MEHFSVICITHKTASLEQVGSFYIDESQRAERLIALRDGLGLDEMMYLSTCNRVEFLIYGTPVIDDVFLKNFHQRFFSTGSIPVSYSDFHSMVEVFEGEHALEHLFRVAASLDSMVVGEREIITQVRNAFEESRTLGLSGDNIRIVMRKTIETAKRVYTETDIARKPVSVVSLAYKALRDLNVDLSARIVMIGAGKTNRTMGKFLLKHGFTNFVVYNRSKERGDTLAAELKGVSLPLSELARHDGGFDVLIACTGASDPIVDDSIFVRMLDGDTSNKVIIDLAVPNDVADSVGNRAGVKYLEVESLQAIARRNLASRQEEVARCEAIVADALQVFKVMYEERRIERAMGSIPAKIKEIREHATKRVFQRELEGLDEESKQVVEKMMDYLEKKYIGLPMKMAKDILIQNRPQ